MAPLLVTLHGADPQVLRARQPLVGNGAWDDQAILTRQGHEVDESLGAADAVWPLDGRDVLKQGKAAVGIKRQDCGAVGKRATCQAGGCWGAASDAGSPLLPRRLSMPTAWGHDAEFAERRATCGVP
jgi:SRSO17 transposase